MATSAVNPVNRFSPEILLKAQGVRIAFFDVDGVLTDGGLYFTESGETIKRFNTLDGHGLKLLQEAGITPVIVSGRDSAPLRTRLKALGITNMYLGTEDKRPAAELSLKALGLTWQQAAVMGDDWPDLSMMKQCTFACSVPNAHIEVKSRAHFITAALAGEGAVREFCDALLLANGHYDRLLKKYTTQ